TNGSVYDMSDLNVEFASVQRAIRPDTVALWLFAALLGLTALLVLGQALARQVWTASSQYPILRALGATRRQFVVAASLPATIVAVGGSAAGVVVAVLGSALTPVGPARVAEPHLGIEVNTAILSIGAVLLLFAVSGQAVLAAWRSTSTSRSTRANEHPSRLANRAVSAGLPAPATTGLRFAFPHGWQSSQVPLYSTLAGTIMAVTALVVAVTFNGDLGRLKDTPARYGWDWNVAVDGGYVPIPAAPVGAALGTVRDVAAWSGGNYGSVVLDGRIVPAVAIDQLHGAVFPTLLEGRPPRNQDEIALGTTTMKAAGVRVGDHVHVQAGGVVRTLLVTGRAVFPDFERGGFAATDLGVGAATTSALLHPGGIPPGATYDFFLVRYRQGVDGARAERTVERVLRPQCTNAECSYFVDRRPNEVNAYGQVAWIPLLLAGVLALLGTLALGHALVSSVRRRRRDIAVLKTLGFTRRQVFMTVAWQATALVLAALVVGLPLGVMVGRWSWKVFAGQLGVATDSLVPVLLLVLAVPVALAVGNMIASLPAWAASRTHPSHILRTD
ncbi:MAG: FtsX-like permease family protein, partial [Acidimicrobiales bacterium]